MIIYVDIDETICVTPKDRDYSKSKPLYDRIAKINDLYNKGHKIVYWTARGSTTGVDWRQLTEYQLSKWFAKHHELRLGKPVYDLFIDDKNINSERFFE
jgi:dTDP-glucose 4,6-dehydratase